MLKSSLFDGVWAQKVFWVGRGEAECRGGGSSVFESLEIKGWVVQFSATYEVGSSYLSGLGTHILTQLTTGVILPVVTHG